MTTNAIQYTFSKPSVYETLLEWSGRETWGNTLAFLRFDPCHPGEMLAKAATVFARSIREVEPRKLFEGRIAA